MDSRPIYLDDAEPTQIDSLPAPIAHMRAAKGGLIPPPLPFALTRKVEARPLTDSDEQWLESLPPATRAVLEAARRPPSEWPIAPRLANAVTMPVITDGAVPLVSAELELV
ncbi:MAG: hypothetical protein K1X94_13540 [Sandaracinaceae bacterium]|nr:hypothetical protein [Sandaracinaceae bacterium]